MNPDPSPAAAERLSRRVLLLFAAYFLLQAVSRVLISPAAELDEAEQLLLTQHLALGYGSQPPLYTWLQSALFALFGPGILPLALLKNLLLFSLYFFTFLAAREMSGEEAPALAATVSLLFIPQIAWESQRDLTHSVLATAMAAATLYAAVCLCRRGRTRDYLLFGLFASLGLLGKYNFALFLASLSLALVWSPEFRLRFLHPRLLFTLLLLVLITAGPLWWAITHTGDTLRQAGTFHREAVVSAWGDYSRGSLALARAILAFAAPLVGIHLLLYLRPGQGNPQEKENPFTSLLRRTLLSGILLCLGLVLVFRVTNFKDRWMQPILFATAIYLPLQFRSRLAAGGVRQLLTFGAAAALLVLLLLPARTLLASHRGRPNQLNAPFLEFANKLQQAGFPGGNIAAGDRWLGGNLRLRFPQSAIAVPELPPPHLDPSAPWLLAWDATRAPELPAELRELCNRLPGCSSGGEARYIEAPFLYDQRTMRLGFLLPNK